METYIITGQGRRRNTVLNRVEVWFLLEGLCRHIRRESTMHLSALQHRMRYIYCSSMLEQEMHFRRYCVASRP